MSASRLTFRQRPVVAAVAAVLIGLVLSIPVDARPGGGGGGGGRGGGGGGFGGGHGGGNFGGNFGGGGSISRPGNIGGGGGISSRPRPQPPIVNPPGGQRPDRPPRPPGRPDHPNRPNVPWIPGAGVWWGAQIADDDWDNLDLVYTLPSNCQQVRVGDQRYLQCGSRWYQKVFNGNQVAYVRVSAPA